MPFIILLRLTFSFFCFRYFQVNFAERVENICAPIIDNIRGINIRESAKERGKKYPRRKNITALGPELKRVESVHDCLSLCLDVFSSYIIVFLFFFLGPFVNANKKSFIKEGFYNTHATNREKIIIHLIKLYVNCCYCATIVFCSFLLPSV